MADVVFILGAGCSVHAGAPVMANFIERARDLFAVNEVKDKQAEFELAFETISHLQRVHSKARLDLNNIESVFSAVDLARTLKMLPGIAPDKIDAAAKALTWLIVRTLEQSIEFQTHGGVVGGTSEYSRLADLIDELNSRTPPLRSAVLTFNYDLAADFSFTAKGLPFHYGLTAGDTRLPLLKLHGSLNWFRVRETKEIAAFYPNDYRQKFRLQHFRGDTDPKVKCGFAADIGKTFRERYSQGVEPEPVLVPPTWSKGEYHREIAPVWSRAAAELKNARYIFVLGYSLPETDQFFRLLFGLGTEGLAILKKIAIFDIAPGPVEERFRAMLGNGGLECLEVFRQEFGQGLKHIDSLLFSTGQRRARS